MKSETPRIEPLINRCLDMPLTRTELIKLVKAPHPEITVVDEEGPITLSTKRMIFIPVKTLKHYELYQGNRVFHVDKKTGEVLKHFIIEP